MKDNLQKLLNKEVSRKEFLQHVGFAVLALIGASGVIKYLLQDSNRFAKQTSGFGSGVYGGTKKRLY